jgi:large subunit ribosomal protein L22
MASKERPESAPETPEPQKAGSKTESGGKAEGESTGTARERAAGKREEKAAGKPGAAEKGKAGKAAATGKGAPGGKPAARTARSTSRTGRPQGAGQEARATARFVRMAPRKLRLMVDAIRGRSASEARNILTFARKRAARTLNKVLASAIANAENNYNLNRDELYVARAWVDQGPTMKSWIPRARGRASPIHKRTSHITIVLKEREVSR